AVVVIAHRLSTAERADRVVVLERGRVVAGGPHDEVLRSSPAYRRMWGEWQAASAAAGPARVATGLVGYHGE
ncbi:MAG: ABC transporter ATP-binding protein/permease, partial [Actinomycetota bacterium]|nr:ABC transporter ATP-binding protein/permease [Actinomycetota bacterium]